MVADSERNRVRPTHPICRLAGLARQILGRVALGPSSCASSSTTPGAGPPAGEEKRPGADAGAAAKASSTVIPEWPVINPYGDNCTLAGYPMVRGPEHAAAKEFFEKVKRREVPPPSDAIAYQYFGEGSWPYHDGKAFVPDPYVMSPEANEVFRPVLRKLVADLKNKSTHMIFEPKVVNGYDTYVDPKRLEAEKQYLFREMVQVAGLSNDLGRTPHNYRRWDCLELQLLLYRDEDGRFRAFENYGLNGLVLVGPEDPRQGNKKELVELIGLDKKKNDALKRLVELPCVEKAGLLFVVPSVPPGKEAAAQQQLLEAMPADLEREYESMRIGDHWMVSSQTIKVKANWKLVNDTYGEFYHLGPLHPILGMISVSNLSDYQIFGDGQKTRNGEPGGVWHGRSSAAKFTARVMAKGEVEEDRWDEPSVNSHLIHLYNLAPNCCLLVRPDGFLTNIMYPGEHAGETICTVAQYLHKPPETAKDVSNGVKVWKVSLDIFFTEDFVCCERIQENVTTNPHAEMVFGRNEVCLIDRHIFYERAIQGKY